MGLISHRTQNMAFPSWIYTSRVSGESIVVGSSEWITRTVVSTRLSIEYCYATSECAEMENLHNKRRSRLLVLVAWTRDNAKALKWSFRYQILINASASIKTELKSYMKNRRNWNFFFHFSCTELHFQVIARGKVSKVSSFVFRVQFSLTFDTSSFLNFF